MVSVPEGLVSPELLSGQILGHSTLTGAGIPSVTSECGGLRSSASDNPESTTSTQPVPELPQSYFSRTPEVLAENALGEPLKLTWSFLCCISA